MGPSHPHVRQVLKLALSISILSVLLFILYTLPRLDPLLLQSGYYRLKAEIGSSFLSKRRLSVSPTFWEKVIS